VNTESAEQPLDLHRLRLGEEQLELVNPFWITRFQQSLQV